MRIAPAATKAARPPRSKTPLVAVAVAIVVLIAGAVIGVLFIGGSGKTALVTHDAASKATSTTQAKTIKVIGMEQVDSGTGCSDPEYLYGVSAGESVTVTDQSGTVIGTTTLINGFPLQMTGALNGVQSCDFAFQFSSLPIESFYGFQVGAQNVVTESLSEVQQDGGTVILTVGGS